MKKRFCAACCGVCLVFLYLRWMNWHDSDASIAHEIIGVGGKNMCNAMDPHGSYKPCIVDLHSCDTKLDH
jgi:hypothetical protein